MTGPWVSAVFSDSFFDPLDFGEKRGAGNRAYTHVAHGGGGGGPQASMGGKRKLIKTILAGSLSK